MREGRTPPKIQFGHLSLLLKQGGASLPRVVQLPAAKQGGFAQHGDQGDHRQHLPKAAGEANRAELQMPRVPTQDQRSHQRVLPHLPRDTVYADK